MPTYWLLLTDDSDFVYGHGSGFEFTQRYGLLSSPAMPTDLGQSHSLWRCHSLHSARYSSYNYYASSESANHRLRPLLPRRDPELCRERYKLLPRYPRHLARADYTSLARIKGGRWQDSILRRRHVVETLPLLLHARRWHEQLFCFGQSWSLPALLSRLISREAARCLYVRRVYS